MLRTLLAAFAQPEPPDRLGTEDARLALAALMVRAARADSMYEASEREEILARLAARHSLPDARARALLAEAEALEAEAPDTVRFTRLIKQAVPYEDRADVMETLWRCSGRSLTNPAPSGCSRPTAWTAIGWASNGSLRRSMPSTRS